MTYKKLKPHLIPEATREVEMRKVGMMNTVFLRLKHLIL